MEKINWKKVIEDNRDQIVDDMVCADMDMCDVSSSVSRAVILCADSTTYTHDYYGTRPQSAEEFSGQELFLDSIPGWYITEDMMDFSDYFFSLYFGKDAKIVQARFVAEGGADDWQAFFESNYPAQYKEMRAAALEMIGDSTIEVVNGQIDELLATL